MTHFTELPDLIEHKKNISICEDLMEMKVAILGKHHLNRDGQKVDNRDLEVKHFKMYLFSHRDFCEHSIVIYSDGFGTRVLKSRLDNITLDNYMNYMGFDTWTY
jgi:hypothetical protein